MRNIGLSYKIFMVLFISVMETLFPYTCMGLLKRSPGTEKRTSGPLVNWKGIIHPDDLPLVLKEERKGPEFPIHRLWRILNTV